VIAAPRALVFKVWSDPVHLPNWFGPEGFTVETKEIDIRVGGRCSGRSRRRVYSNSITDWTRTTTPPSSG
jgi:uncharacterized protein YndB with AHSA1/START domain